MNLSGAWWWIGTNSSQVVAAATVAGALAAIIYAGLTVGLWKAATRQANTTQQMFEALYRPYLDVNLDTAAAYVIDGDRFWLPFPVMNVDRRDNGWKPVDKQVV